MFDAIATVLETVLDEVSYEADDKGRRAVVIDAPEVRTRLAPLLKDRDLSRFIL